MSEWQPIETVPYDGTEVILWLGEPWSECAMAGWFTDWGVWLRHGENEPSLRELDYGVEPWGIGSAIPTHWMPMPPAPEENK